MNRKHFTAIDLFCGVGGVTVGLKMSGFNVIAGVELDNEIGDTYKTNHPDVYLIREDIRNLNGRKILRKLGVKSVDVVVGCPPCQGFSKLTDKWHRSDKRNDLLMEMARIVKETRPKICMMENVFGLGQRGRAMLDDFVEELKSVGYKVEWKVMQLADYGIPQSRLRVVLIASIKTINVEFPKPSYAHTPPKGSAIKKWRVLKDVFDRRLKVVPLSFAKKKGGPQNFNWWVCSDIKSATRRRLMAGKPGGTRFDLPTLLRPNCHKGNNKGFQNVYTRLSWNQTSPTITGGCITPAKGRFGHPSQIRALSIREAALIQTFPKNYLFKTDSIGLASQMIGNALPCDFAGLMGKQLRRALEKRKKPQHDGSGR